MNLSHNKLKNIGLIYECLLRTVTKEVMEGKNSNAINIIKKFFSKTELAKEYKLYQYLNEKNQLTEVKSGILVESLISQYKKINRDTLKSEKYKLIKEIKENYNIDEFFKYKIPNYKQLAALCSIFEINSNTKFENPSSVIEHKSTLIEYLSSDRKDKSEIEDKLMEEYINLDKGTKLLVFRTFVEKFNKKYSNLLNEQKVILKEYINNFDNTSKLKQFINKHQELIKEKLSILYYQIEDKTTQIKLNEAINLIKPLQTIKDSDVISLLSYYELISEIEKQVK